MKLSLISNIFSKDESVIARLGKTVVLTTASLAVISVLYAVSQIVAVLSVNTIGAEISAYQELTDVQRLMLQARTNEKDFFARKNPKYIDQHAETMASVYANLDKARSGLGDKPALLKLVADVETAARTYQEEFGKTADTQVLIGLDENSGLHGSLRKSVHDVEELLKKTGNLPMTVSMLQMRRNEKDFFQRGDNLKDQQKYRDKQTEEYANFRRLSASLPAASGQEIRGLAKSYFGDFVRATDGYENLVKGIALFRDAAQETEPLLAELNKQSDTSIRAQLVGEQRTLTISALALTVLLVGLGFTTFRLLKRVQVQIAPSLEKLRETVGKIASGDAAARARLDTRDEFGELGGQFDSMMDEREVVAAKLVEDNEQLNQSVLNMLQAVAKMAQRDLTSKAPVAADVTGAVSDAINLMSEETAKVLAQVIGVAQGVAGASNQVRAQSDTAMNVAHDDKIKVEQAGRELQAAAETMAEIARLALATNESAARAIATTDKAQETVLGTVEGIAGIRDTIRETEKRIKRLGERSQEIGGVVSLINNIAERTHILALNASMHAASAGEAGRGFAVVANEVQRLAESAREATGQIAGLVNNIQAETADTVSTMNEAITRVVEGTKLAERAGAEMGDTRAVTSELVEYVKRIDESSKQQSGVAQRLVERATELQASAQVTYDTLQSQAKLTAELTDFSDRLLASVSVFTLPEDMKVTVQANRGSDAKASSDLKRAA